MCRWLIVALVCGSWCSPSRAQDAGPYGNVSLPEAARAVPTRFGARTGEWQTEPPGWHAPSAPRRKHFLLPGHLRHTDPDDPGRHVGLGHPLSGTSWRNRPLHVGWLFGGLFGDDLIRGRLGQDEDMIGGYRCGWDFDHYWGSELRFAFANLEMKDLQTPSNRLGTSRDHFWDVHLLYYPWGDARFRPYFTLGAGLASFSFRDGTGQGVNETLFALPFGLGVKYYWDKWLAIRFALMDNWSWGAQGLSSMHNVSLTGGVEVRLGGWRRSYFPHHPGGYLK